MLYYMLCNVCASFVCLSSKPALDRRLNISPCAEYSWCLLAEPLYCRHLVHFSVRGYFPPINLSGHGYLPVKGQAYYCPC